MRTLMSAGSVKLVAKRTLAVECGALQHTGSTCLAVIIRDTLLFRTQTGSVNTLIILQVISRQAVTLAGCGDGDTLITTHPGISQTLITTEYQAWLTLTITRLSDRLALTLAGG